MFSNSHSLVLHTVLFVTNIWRCTHYIDAFFCCECNDKFGSWTIVQQCSESMNVHTLHRVDVMKKKSIVIKLQVPRDACQSKICSCTENIKWSDCLGRITNTMRSQYIRSSGYYFWLPHACYVVSQFLHWKKRQKNHRTPNEFGMAYTVCHTALISSVRLHKHK